MNRIIFTRLAISAGLLFASVPAFAVDGPKPVDIDGGPLGQLQFSAAADGYFYYQTGTSDNGNSIAGS